MRNSFVGKNNRRNIRIEKTGNMFLGVPDEIFGDRRHLIPVEKAENYDLKYPIDHVEYEKLDPYYEFKGMKNIYFHDKDGYNFANRDFS